jgi:hypothetical protein
MGNSEASEKIWLVRSSSVILGPFTFREVLAQIQIGRVSLLDEVRSPERRWLFFRESREFSQAIKELGGSPGETTGSVRSSQTASLTIELTPPPEELTPPPVSSPAPVKVYTSAWDPKLNQQMEAPRKRARLWIGLGSLGLLLAFIFLLPQDFRDLLNLRRSQDLLALARRAQSVGQYEQALHWLRKVNSPTELGVVGNLQFAELLMFVENQNIQARQLLDRLVVPQEDAFSARARESLLALSFLRERQWPEAELRYEKLLSAHPDHQPAHLNLIESAILQGHLDLAHQRLQSWSQQGANPELLIYRIILSLQGFGESVDWQAYEKDLKERLEKSSEMQNVKLLTLAAVQQRLEKPLESLNRIRALINSDPQHDENYLFDLLEHREVFRWNFLGAICEGLVQAGSGSALYRALSAFCVYEKGELAQAISQTEEARVEFADDPQLLGLHAFLLYKAGRKGEAQALLKVSDRESSLLRRRVEAALCEDNANWSCAKTEWAAVLENDPKDLSAIAGLARMALSQGQRSQAKEIIERGMGISQSFAPLLQLKEQVSE